MDDSSPPSEMASGSNLSKEKSKQKVACTRCRGLKARCPGPASEGESSCSRCVRGGHDCISMDHRRGRKVGSLRGPSASLKPKSKKKESKPKETAPAQPRSVPQHTPSLPQPPKAPQSPPTPSSASSSSSSSTSSSSPLDSLPTSSTLSARLQLSPPQNIDPPPRPSSSSLAQFFAVDADEDIRRGRPTDLPLFREDPIELRYLSEEDSKELFRFFMAMINPRMPLFDETLHTHDYVRSTSQLLFCTILSVALKFSPSPEIETRARVLGLAKDQMLRIVGDDGTHLIESVQALLLMVEYKEPTDEQSYVLLGLACRLAMELNLGQPLPQLDARHNQNRTRTWLMAYIVDRRVSKYGQELKATMVGDEDATIVESSTFHLNSVATEFDSRLVALAELRRLVSRYDSILKEGAFNLREAVVAAESELEEWGQRWGLKGDSPNDISIITNYVNHGKLQIAQHWLFQIISLPVNAPKFTSEKEEALECCIQASFEMLSRLATVPAVVLCYAPDSFHLFFSYPTFFLRRIFKAQLLDLLDPSSSAIFQGIRRAADALEAATLHPSNTIALHAQLIRSLLTFAPPTTPISPPFPKPPSEPTLPRSTPIATASVSNLLANSLYFPPPDASTEPLRLDFYNPVSTSSVPIFKLSQQRSQASEVQPSFSTSRIDPNLSSTRRIPEEGAMLPTSSTSETQLDTEKVYESLEMEGVMGLNEGGGWEELFSEGGTGSFDFLLQN